MPHNVATGSKNLSSNRSLIHATFSKPISADTASDLIDNVEEIGGSVSEEGFVLIGTNDRDVQKDFFTLKTRFGLPILTATLMPNKDLNPNARPKKLI